MPTYTQVDYVEVYSYNEADKSFNLEYRDDFNSLNDGVGGMWGKADGNTWDDLASTFLEENVHVEDGHLLLSLTKNNDYDGGDGDDGDFHVLPPPKDGTLEQAIEKATRVAVTMVRSMLNEFADSMSHHY